MTEEGACLVDEIKEPDIDPDMRRIYPAADDVYDPLDDNDPEAEAEADRMLDEQPRCGRCLEMLMEVEPPADVRRDAPARRYYECPDCMPVPAPVAAAEPSGRAARATVEEQAGATRPGRPVSGPYRTSTPPVVARRTLRQRAWRWFTLRVLSPEWQVHRRAVGGPWEAGSWSTDENGRITTAYRWFQPSKPYHDDDSGPIRVMEEWPEVSR
jgi:hypothetical protein